jgi:hypothetical protein
MDLIDEHVTTRSLDPKLDTAIRASLGLAKKTLNRYYTKTDDSEVYRIAMGERFSPAYFLVDDAFQFYTLDTSFPTLSALTGNKNGLTLQRRSYAPSLSKHTLTARFNLSSKTRVSNRPM